MYTKLAKLSENEKPCKSNLHMAIISIHIVGRAMTDLCMVEHSYDYQLERKAHM